ncbi:MAG: hypothetical protein CMF49_02315 [Legionellales bacterium]|nr:hypothetical protein [Legionellales bacterium]|tara:strand:- start:710 stop:1420 length:711 start_codon:yes stop_codon:yes gene_type:complete
MHSKRYLRLDEQPQYYKVKFLKAKKSNHEIIIFVHGLFRSYRSMYLLARFFRKKAYDCYLFDYPSTKHMLQKHIDGFSHFLNHCITQHPHEKIHIITHSMGGILLRGALNQLSTQHCQHIQSVVMLVPPNQGSPYASKILTWLPKIKLLIKPLFDISHLPQAHVHTLKSVCHPNIGIIAAKYDKKAPSELAHLPYQKDFMIINITHSLIIDHPKTKKAILNFIRFGRFLPQNNIFK